ncbi:MAG: hypothetical protein JWO30_850 [Fibrobacteres bacterium]|nr:hypothetical protein [Fibrobacterota bacterium]
MKTFAPKASLPVLGTLAGLILFHGPVSAKEHDDHNNRQGFQVGLWGDLPYAKIGYGGADGPKMQALIKDMNNADLEFSIFDGDTKDGSSLCTDAALSTDPTRLFNSFVAPVVYVPGDNEWTDCHRTNNGSYNALERLDYVRRTMHNSRFSFGQHKMKLERQGALGQAYSENTRWSKEGVYFVGLNVPGSDNNKVNAGQCLSSKSARTDADCIADNAEYAQRNAQNLAWLSESFEVAKAHGSPGLMIVIQADPGFDWPETETVNERLTNPNIDGYNDLLARLVTEAANFDGEIALVHGDTHYFKIDKPLLDPTHLVANITRVQTFGETNVHWVRATVHPKSRNVFKFEPMIVPGN